MTQAAPLSALLVDDDPDMIVFVRDLLGSSPTGAYDVAWTPSADEALKLLQSRTYDAALIDHHLPAMTGLELVKRLRAANCETPLIMITARAGRALDLEAMDAGADDFLDKATLTPELLERALRYAARNGRARRQLRESEEHFRALIQHSSDAMLLLDSTGTVLFASDSFEGVTGMPPSAVIGRNAFERIHPDDVSTVRAGFAECLANAGRPFHGEYRALHADGTWREREVTAVSRLDNPAVRAVVVNYRDVTLRKRAEHEYRSIFENSPIGLAHVNLYGRWMRVNARLCEIVGYSPDELSQLTFADLSHPEDVNVAVKAASSLISGEITRYDVEKRYRRKDGADVWVRVFVTLYRDSAGAPQYFIAAVDDVTAQRAVEDELKRSHHRLHAIVASIPMAIVVLDPEGVITFAEGRLFEQIGTVPAELIGKSQLALYAQHPEIVETTRKALTGEQVHATVTLDRHTFEVWFAPLHDDGGRMAGTIGVAVDISQRLQLEEQFRQAQKMEAIGRLAGGVAHDFNNLLTAIIGYGELALDDLPPGATGRSELEEIHKAATSAAGLTRQLLAFSRRQMLQPQTIHINDIVRRLKSLLQRMIGEDIRLETRLGESLGPVHADPTQIEQILMNLAVNARDAMPQGGELLIETGNCILDDSYIATHRGAALGPHAMIAVTDTGVGMDAQTQARLFEPFFTTKERGTGLGLATVYGIVQQSGGSLEVDSEPGRGTTFKIFLPIVERSAVSRDARAVMPQSLHGNETVLVVDDQADVRAIARETLTRYGYVVIEAPSPLEALQIIATGRHIHLLFTDLVMPHMSGRELARVAHARLPDLRVIYMSGYTDRDIVDRSVLEPNLAFLPKPFTGRNLLTKVREVLDADAAPQV